jgi:YD repeat-containing protein
MYRFSRIFFPAYLLLLCVFAVSCDDDDAVCSTQYLTKVSSPDITDDFYYNDDGTLATVIQTIGGFPPRRNEYFYDGNQRLIRIEQSGLWDYEFFYDDNGRVETVEMYQSGTDDLAREVNYFYGSDGKLSRRDMIQAKGLIHYSLYEYPAENKVEVTFFNLEEDDTYSETVVIHTLDDKRVPFPIQYSMGWDVLGGITTEHNVIQYEAFKDGVLDQTQSFSLEFTYNEAGYPVTVNGVPGYSYSCDPLKEQ